MRSEIELVGSDIKTCSEFAEKLGLPFPLRDYQWEGVSFLAQNEAVLLADEMGLGKTVQTAVALSILVRQHKCQKILIVCPSSLCHNWELELKRWAPKLSVRKVKGNACDRKAHFLLPFQIWIASYEQIRTDIDLLNKDYYFDLVILDEAQRVKNSSSTVALACRQLNRRCSWALTGTPVENSPDDLLSIFAFVQMGLINSALTRTEIHAKIEPHFLRRKKKEVLKELPSIIMQDLQLELEEAQRIAYDLEWVNTRERLRISKGDKGNMGLLASITRLKQLCNFAPEHETSCKLNALRNVIEECRAENDKIIVFSQYVETLLSIKRHLTNIHPLLFHGKLSSEDKTKIVSAFEELPGPQVLLMSLRAGGVGLNIGSASTVVLFDRWWNPAVENQAIQRAHRYGRKLPLHAIRFLVTDTVEERIEKILEEKQTTFEEYIDGIECKKSFGLSHDDLVRIMGLGVMKV